MTLEAFEDTGDQDFGLTLVKYDRAESQPPWRLGPAASQHLATLRLYWAAIPQFVEFQDVKLTLGTYGPFRAKGSMVLAVPGWLSSDSSPVPLPPLNRRCSWGFTWAKYSELSFGFPPPESLPDATPPATTGLTSRNPNAFVSPDSFSVIPGMCRDSTPFDVSYAFSSSISNTPYLRLVTVLAATLTAVR